MTLPSIGDVVDNKFRIERKLGEGGTSTIYEVRHLITEKKFAIKWLAPELASNDLAVQLLFHEAKVSGRFVHPNAVQIYDICRSSDSYYLVMEFLEGESLETRLHREQRLSVRAACDILLPCIEALSAAHRAGIVHRDLKPSNIFLCRFEGQDAEVPKVLDFGISNYVHGGIDISPTGSGTPLYMAPEQMWSQPADPKFDIYALGVVLYELVSGKPPFDSDDFDDLVHLIVESRATRLDQILQVEPAFADIVARAMARGSDDRFATMAELAAALRPYSSRIGMAAQGGEAAEDEQPAAPVASRQSDAASTPPRRSSWTSTTLGFAVAQHPAVAAAKAAESKAERSEPILELADLAGTLIELEPEPNAEPPNSIVQASETSTAVQTAAPETAPASALTASASRPAPIIVRPGTLPLRAADASPVVLATAAPPAATPPIVVPPPRPVVLARARWGEDQSDGKTPWIVDDVVPPPRGQQRYGLIAALGGALLLTCYALARELQPETETAISPAQAVRPGAGEAAAPHHVTAVPEPSAPSPAEPVEAPQPFAAPAPAPPVDGSAAAKAEERRAARQQREELREQRAAKRAAKEASAAEARAAQTRVVKEPSTRRTRSEAEPKEFSIPSRRQAAAEENDVQRDRPASESPRGFSLPDTGLSRGDF